MHTYINYIFAGLNQEDYHSGTRITCDTTKVTYSQKVIGTVWKETLAKWQGKHHRRNKLWRSHEYSVIKHI